MTRWRAASVTIGGSLLGFAGIGSREEVGCHLAGASGRKVDLGRVERGGLLGRGKLRGVGVEGDERRLAWKKHGDREPETIVLRAAVGIGAVGRPLLAEIHFRCGRFRYDRWDK